MFQDRIFAVAFSISLLWHLVWMSLVSITVPQNVRPAYSSRVSFLGPILDRSSFDTAMKYEPSVIDAGHKLRSSSVEDFISQDAPLIPQASRDVPAVPTAEGLDVSQMSFALDTKKTPEYFDESPVDVVPAAGKGLIEGPAQGRALLHRPELPAMPELLDVKDKIFNVRLKFYLAQDGSVDKAELLSSSGYPDVDILATGYLKRWEFEPRQDARDVSWGIVNLRFEAK